ncbi:CooT family nickel-binding protein [Pseudobacteroides cellulosolvens]|uniref:RNA-binding protein n=1 Tax=Pseudobacteroides cellulosolvens ATCC 35603 = DSM 2933 TaxID=398512 RepID=A0A0L6JXI1_9FIRM|nr:CooT family nickel-binding protein [Pseudobacteroides cellulosolvens]KNY30152.1 RNA-binding protein [Pseudobacteroides cellulosolvens ATCC 35603 = DSM 2933]
MCEANVYIINKDGDEELVLESVDKIFPGDGIVELENVFSERKTIKGKIKEMALVDHKIIIEEI